MKNDLIFIVQECICIDFLINAIMKCNIYKHLKFFNNLKKTKGQKYKNYLLFIKIYL